METRRSAGETRDSRFSQIIELMRDSVITQALVTVMALAATLWIVIEGRTVPGELWAIDGLTLGFYFGGKVQSGAARLVERHVSRLADAAEARRGSGEQPD